MFKKIFIFKLAFLAGTLPISPFSFCSAPEPLAADLQSQPRSATTAGLISAEPGFDQKTSSAQTSEVFLMGEENTLSAPAVTIHDFVVTGDIVLDSGSGYTNTLQTTLHMDALASTGAPIASMCYSVNDSSPAACSSWETFNPVKTISIPAYQGTNYVNVRLRDSLGNEAFFWKTLVYDPVAPTGTLAINQGQVATSSPVVNLQITGNDAGSGVAEMGFSVNSQNDADFSAWEEFSTSKTLTLPDFQGTNYVNVRLRDRAGNIHKYIFDSIVLDRTAPQANFTINGGVSATHTNAVALQLSASDNLSGPLEMSYSINGLSNFSAWEAFAPAKNLTLPDFLGTNYINVKVRDQAGNETLVWKTVVLDKTPPSGSFTVNGGVPAASSQSILLNLSGSDASSGIAQMSFSVNSTAPDDFSAWENFQTSKTLSLPNYPGTNYLNVKLRDFAGNEYFMFRTIVYDPVSRQYQLERAWLNPGNNPNFFGFDSAAVGKNLLVGAPNEDDPGASAGAVHLYNNDSSSINYGQKILTILNPRGLSAEDDFFGTQVAALGTYGLVSAVFQDAGGVEFVGAVMMYQLDPASPDFGSLIHTFSNPSPAFDDEFGTRIRVVGTKIFISATDDSTAGEGAGAVYMYEGDPASPNFGALLKTFLNPSPGTTRFFGASITEAGVNGDKLLVSTPADSSGDFTTGKAWLFDANPGSATFGQLLRTFTTPAVSSTDWFGSAVASWGKYVFISAENASRIYMYDAEPSSPTYGQLIRTLQTETPSENDPFGRSMIISGSRLIVADSGGGGDGSGKVFVFNIDPFSATFGSLIQTVSNPFPLANDGFGYTITVLGNGRIAIGSPIDNTSADWQGAVYTFSLN